MSDEIKKNKKLNINIDSIIIAIVLIFEVCNSKLLGISLPILIIRYLSKYRDKKFKITIDRYMIWIILVFIAIFLNGIRLSNNGNQFSILYNLVTFMTVIFIYLIIRKNDYETTLKVVVRSSVIASIFMGIYILINEYSMILYRLPDYLKGTCGYRLGISSGINPNTITWTFGFFSLFLLYDLLKNKKLSLCPIYIFNLLIIFLTGSKNGLVLALIPFTYFAIKAIRQRKIKQLILILVFFVVLWILIHKVVFLYTLIGSRIDSMIYTLFSPFFSNNITVGSIDVASTEKRVNMIHVGMNMFYKKPILGWGIGSFARYSGFGYYSHNNYVEILVSGGLLLFILYYGFILYSAKKIIKNRQSESTDLAIILLLSLIMLDFSTVNFYANVIFYFRTIVMFNLIINSKKLEGQTKND